MTGKFIKIFLIYFFGTLSVTLIALVSVLLILNVIITPTYIQENNIIKEKCGENIIEKISEIAWNMSNHTYTPYKYDCSQFSLALVQELKAINISSYCIFGFITQENKSVSHIWVQMIIENKIYNLEATSGFWISDDEYKTHYKEIKKGFCF